MNLEKEIWKEHRKVVIVLVVGAVILSGLFIINLPIWTHTVQPLRTVSGIVDNITFSEMYIGTSFNVSGHSYVYPWSLNITPQIAYNTAFMSYVFTNNTTKWREAENVYNNSNLLSNEISNITIGQFVTFTVRGNIIIGVKVFNNESSPDILTGVVTNVTNVTAQSERVEINNSWYTYAPNETFSFANKVWMLWQLLNTSADHAQMGYSPSTINEIQQEVETYYSIYYSLHYGQSITLIVNGNNIAGVKE